MPTFSLASGPVRFPSRPSLLPLVASGALALLTLATTACELTALPDTFPDDAPLPPAVQGEEPVEPEAPQEPTPPRADGPTLGACTAAPRWVQTEANLYVLDNSFLGITPNEGLILATDTVGGTGVMVRMDDGEVLAQGALSGLMDVDRQWRRRLDNHGDHLAVRDLITADELGIVGGMAYNASGALSADGRRVASVRCEEGTLTLAVRDIDLVTTLWEAPLDVALAWCPSWSEITPLVTFGPSDDVVVVGVPTSGTVHVVDVAAGTESVTQAHTMPTPEENNVVTSSALLGLATDASGSLLVTTGGDGLLKRFKLPGMVPAGEPLEVGVVAVNLSVYALPRMASPVAVSPDGDVIAAITPWVLNDDETEVLVRSLPVLLDAGTGEVIETLDVGIEVQDPDLWWDDGDRAVGFAFSPSGGALIGRFGGGLALWACEDFTTPSPAAPLSVLLQGPDTVTVGEEVTFTATHLGSDALHAHTFLLDGELLWGRGGLERTATWAFSEAGEHEITVVVDDGASTGSASMMVTVTE
jgi:hypothetical protein